MDQTKMVKAVFNDYAELYQEKFMATDLYHNALDLFCNAMKSGKADILEIACGPGNITQYLLQQNPSFNILGIDLAPKMLDLARINNPSATFQLMDARDISQLKPSFDGIVCGFCLPYLSKAEALAFIQDAASLLKPGGCLYLSTMEDDYHLSGLEVSNSGKGPAIYIYYHEEDYLKAALEEAGFEIIALKRQKYPEAKRPSTQDLLVIGRKSA